MNEPVIVEARFDTDGTLRPLAFTWSGKRYPILSYGRQWEEEGERGFFVMTPGDEVFELVYLHDEGAWRLRRAPGLSGERRAV